MKKSQSKKVNRAWINDHIQDPWVKLAQKEGYRARAVYKLKEIDEKFSLIKPDSIVVDLGSAPGAWSQYIRNRLYQGRAADQVKGALFSLDLLPMEPIENVNFLQGDFREAEVLAAFEDLLRQKLSQRQGLDPAALTADLKVDLVVSDMAPNLSGIKMTDSVKIAHLIELALDFAQNHLRTDGALLVKLFHGSGYSQLVDLFKQNFSYVKPIKPIASRKKSSETFLLGVGIKR